MSNVLVVCDTFACGHFTTFDQTHKKRCGWKFVQKTACRSLFIMDIQWERIFWVCSWNPSYIVKCKRMREGYYIFYKINAVMIPYLVVDCIGIFPILSEHNFQLLNFPLDLRRRHSFCPTHQLDVHLSSPCSCQTKPVHCFPIPICHSDGTNLSKKIFVHPKQNIVFCK